MLQVARRPLFFGGVVGGNHLEPGHVQHHDGAVSQFEPAQRHPGPQLPVYALPRHPDHFAEFLLGDGDLAGLGSGRIALTQPDQGLGEACLEVGQADLLDMFAHPAQPLAQQLDELHQQHRLALHEGQEVALVEGQDLAGGVGDRICRPRRPVEKRDLAEQRAGGHQVEDGAAAAGGGDADLDGAAHHQEQPVAGIALREHHRAFAEFTRLGVLAQLGECIPVDLAKDRVRAEKRDLVVEPGGVLRHIANHISRACRSMPPALNRNHAGSTNNCQVKKSRMGGTVALKGQSAKGAMSGGGAVGFVVPAGYAGAVSRSRRSARLHPVRFLPDRESGLAAGRARRRHGRPDGWRTSVLDSVVRK